MERIERYELIEELHTGGPVTVWRARDTLHEGAEVTLELVAVNAEAVRSLRASAHERSRREKHVTVRIFEDLERARAACDRGSWCPSRVLTREYMGKTDERA